MIEEMSKPPFSPELIQRARELNKDKSISGDIYFHPTESNIVVKSIDLSMRHPLCGVNTRPRSSSEERWLEAYLIRKAKRNNWMLEFANERYELLYSQLKFRSEQKTPGEEHTLLDLLLCDEYKKNLVILELKSKRELKKAKEELCTYNRKISECKDGLIEAFALDKNIGIFSYIVWPASSREGKWSQDLGKHLGDYGLIEYEYDKSQKPWEAFRKDEDFNIKFTYRKPAQRVSLR